MSRPPTPPADPPASRAQWRFHALSAPTEWIEDYRPGKYHPVHFRDNLKSSRYRIIRKLGYGSFSTVWLAKDHMRNQYVTVKILIADPDASKHELAILQVLSRSSAQGKSHVMNMLDFFEHKGPNGVHRCLVFELMGPSVASASEDLLDDVVDASSEQQRFPIWMVKRILHHTLLGIEFLHANGIAHGDLQQGNLLFPVKDLSTVGEEELSRNDEISEPVRRLDGRTDLWAPKYLALDQPLSQYIDASPGFNIKISDLGGAFFLSDPSNKLVTPVALRSPELIFEKKINKDQDIWSFGCLIFELFTSRHLFLVTDMGREEEVNDDHFLQFNDVLGPLPGTLLAKYPRAHIYYNEKGEKVKNYIGELPEGFDPSTIEPSPSLEQAFDKEKPVDIDDEEGYIIKGILRCILDYDPAKRPSASELLKHPWFSAIASEEETNVRNE
ncbi:uncharacterized protein TRUGW13939_04878 [Talaromyces rugulosus]|uniref:Protein kinase domain-containing protein n=1 Tax=Talaromyces rugulosus TaxID=121627 RepID=A0A7H8QVQ1_TALRU|nr:uncharacterized protein TRUGW13939_04878 [Talaromyces rugulosus]QKX57758.1 hypothetical protein TRUGW13939_04878 [Talaromyces rugulosus]